VTAAARSALAVAVLLALLCAFGALFAPGFLSAGNLENLARRLGLFGILSLGVGLVIVTGGIDLSVGSLQALLGVTLAIALREWQWPPLAALGLVLALPCALGAVHGLLVVALRVQPFLVTLCGLLIYRGLARVVAGDETKGFGTAEGFEGLRDAASGEWLGLPAPFVALVLVAGACHVLLHHSVFGRYLFAIGCNELATRHAGVRTGRVVFAAYVLCSALAGLAGVLFAFYTNSIQPSNYGAFYELYAVAAAVLGGFSLRGGQGVVAGILCGTAAILVIENLVNLLDVQSAWYYAVLGGVILVAVVLDGAMARRR
jgi:ribose transport system permease protein